MMPAGEIVAAALARWPRAIREGDVELLVAAVHALNTFLLRACCPAAAPCLPADARIVPIERGAHDRLIVAALVLVALRGAVINANPAREHGIPQDGRCYHAAHDRAGPGHEAGARVPIRCRDGRLADDAVHIHSLHAASPDLLVPVMSGSWPLGQDLGMCLAVTGGSGRILFRPCAGLRLRPGQGCGRPGRLAGVAVMPGQALLIQL